jgi:iron(III) transport system ATP-binding protein
MNELAIRNVEKSLGRQKVLHDIDLALATGSRSAIVGPSGSGKSTLLRLIAGFERVDRGEIRIDGQVLSSVERHLPAHRRRIGYVPQDGALFPHLTAAQNIGFGVRGRADKRTRVREAAELSGLETELLDRYPHQLSGGQQQRVALARALAPRPRLMLLDEPFSALDTGLRASTRQAVIDTLQAAGMTTVLVTHDQDEALTFGDHIAVLEGGTVQQDGPPDVVFEQPRTLEIARFLGEVILLNGRVDGGRFATALGDLAITSDRRTEHAGAVLLIRPSQVTLHAADGAANARVVSTTPEGQYARVEVELSDQTRLGVLVPTHQLSSFALGAEVRATVEGPGTLFDEPAESADR